MFGRLLLVSHVSNFANVLQFTYCVFFCCEEDNRYVKRIINHLNVLLFVPVTVLFELFFECIQPLTLLR